MYTKGAISIKKLLTISEYQRDIWIYIMGERVHTHEYSYGTVIDTFYINNQTYITIRFDLGSVEMIYDAENFCNLFKSINNVSLDIKEKIERLYDFNSKVRAVDTNFQAFKKNYVLSDYKFTQFLYSIFMKIADDNPLQIDDNDIDILAKNKYYDILQIIAQKYMGMNMIAKAASIYRKGKMPEESIRITEDFNNRDNKILSMVKTTRGGAFRDIGDYNNAEKMAKEAIDLNNDDYRPWNLLGAIFIQTGRYEEAFECFKKALDLGKPVMEERNTRDTIRDILEEMTTDVKIYVGQKLLELGPNKFSWLKAYLNIH